MDLGSERAYRELRALNEDLLRARPGQRRARLRAALAESLRLHCREYGALIDLEPRLQGDQFCYACVAPVQMPTDLASDLAGLDDERR